LAASRLWARRLHLPAGAGAETRRRKIDATFGEEGGALVCKGEDLADMEKDAEALIRFQEAWEALPEPRDEQELAIQILAALADSHFYLGNWEECRKGVQHAFRCGADVTNSFLRLRLGQALYELGDEQEAANWLVPVYLQEGRKPFENEDPKYLEFFRSRLAPPPGGWPDGW
jgi:hypothetical protein